jgi:hypothetical protein
MNVKELQFTLKIHLKLRHDTYQLLRWSRVVFRILNMCHARISFYGSITALLWLYYGSITALLRLYSAHVLQADEGEEVTDDDAC